MEIQAVALKNFKTHGDRYFPFQPGTNAICGANGAGKTSILEAIAWVLFDYNGYSSKADLIKAGQTSAQVTVTMVSSHDGRSYEVRRCTSKGYEIYDPQLRANLGLKKLEDVTLWLRQHLGVAAGTELSKLFADTIGIPQGTFTSDFLKPPDGRRRVFDPILKVEEYKQAYLKANDLETYAKGKVRDLEQQVNQYELQLADWETLQQTWAEKSQEITQDRRQLRQLQQRWSQLETEKSQLLAQEAQVQGLKTQLDQLAIQIQAQEAAQQVLADSLTEAQQAGSLCEIHHSSYLIYKEAVTTLETLEEQRQQQLAIQEKRQKYQERLSQRQLEAAKLESQLEALATAAAKITDLAPLQQQQQLLEQQLTALEQSFQTAQAAQLQVQTLSQQQQQLQLQLQHLQSEIQRLIGLSSLVAEIPHLEQERDRHQQHLSRIEAARQFQTELQQLVNQGAQQRQQHRQQAEQALAFLATMVTDNLAIPLAIAAINAGLEMNQQLLEALGQILADLNAQVDLQQLEQESQSLATQLQAAYQARGELAALASRQAEAQKLARQIRELEPTIQAWHSQIGDESELLDQRTALKTQLTALGDPAGQIRLLQQQVQHRSQLQPEYEQVEQNLARGQALVVELEQELTAFSSLTEHIQAQKQTQQSHAQGYQIYLQQQQTAAKLPQLATQMQQAIAQQSDFQQQFQQLQQQWQHQSQDYDPDRLQQVLTDVEQTKTQQDQLSGGLGPKQEQLADLEQQLATRQVLAQERDRTLAELEQQRQVQHFITEARSIYNKSGPRISGYYLRSISQAADRLFRELLNRPDVNLEWTEDYEIRLQEGGYWRSFKSLSGGEQMCAALAVRLSLLKVLADIDIAFFDEPTTNMDQTRRLQLAEALSNLKSFRQLFVISHDDTFESMTENVIRVGH